MHWGKVGCESVVFWILKVSVKSASFLEGSVNIYPALTTPHRRASISIIIKLVFYLWVTFTIKGETQMGSVSYKDSTGY